MKSSKHGQNFLTNQNVADKIVTDFFKLHNKIKYPILEIGPGKGVLTKRIVDKTISPIYCIEKDSQLYQTLKDDFSEKLNLINEDILKVSLSKLPISFPIDIISNIPYYISSNIIDWIISYSSMINCGILMMQKEFCDKLLLKTKIDPRVLIFNFIFKINFKFYVSKGSFTPSPTIRSSVFSFLNKNIKKDPQKIKLYYTFLKLCFSSRRKKIINNLSQYYPIKLIQDFFRLYNITPNIRAEELSGETLFNLYSHLIVNQLA